MDILAINDTARAQHGLITRAQVLELGLTPRQLEHGVQTGRWQRVARGVYLVGAAPHTWEQQVLSACLAAGSDALASHRTAARLWDLVDRCGRLEVTLSQDRRVRAPGMQVHRSILLPASDRSVRKKIPVTSLARTIADASGGQGAEVAGRWVDEAIRRHRLDLHDLRSCVARLAGPGRRDLSALRIALAARLPGYDPGDSDLEVRALRLLARADLPAPIQQHLVRRQDGSAAYIDVAYPWAMVAIELDGWAFHSSRTAFDRDRARHNDLTLLGWQVFHFTASTPDAAFVATIRAALQASRHAASGFQADSGLPPTYRVGN